MNDIAQAAATYMKTDPLPVLFIGHGTPMNAIEENEFTDTWKELGKTLPRPEAVLCISAHWEEQETVVTATDAPETVHDFRGFPEQLYRTQYPAPGAPDLAGTIRNRIVGFDIKKDHKRGLDHGAWCFLDICIPKTMSR